MLWQLKSTSPFHGFRDEPFSQTPRSLTPEEYLTIWVEEAAPADWAALAQVFLDEMNDNG